MHETLAHYMLYVSQTISLGFGLRSGEIRLWAHQDSNLGPSDYESDALTN